MNSLRLLVVETLRTWSSLDRQVIILGMVLRSASIVALRISLACVSALLLNEDSLERGSCSAIGYHHLFGIIEHLGIAYAS